MRTSLAGADDRSSKMQYAIPSETKAARQGKFRRLPSAPRRKKRRRHLAAAGPVACHAPASMFNAGAGPAARRRDRCAPFPAAAGRRILIPDYGHPGLGATTAGFAQRRFGPRARSRRTCGEVRGPCERHLSRRDSRCTCRLCCRLLGLSGY